MPKNNFKLQKNTLRRGILIIISILPVASSTISQIYSGCCKGSSCFGFGKGSDCITGGAQNCDLLISYKPTGSNRISFKIVGRKLADATWGSYIAMGISVGPQMGDDLVVACKFHRGSAQVKAQLYFNDITRKTNKFASTQYQATAAYEENGFLACEFDIDGDITITGGQNFKMNSNKYHILGAKGEVNYPGDLLKHNPGQNWASGNPISLKETGKCKIVTSDQFLRNIVNGCHLIFMVFSFISFIPTGMLIGRFLKESHSATRCCRLRVWHILHFSSLGVAHVLILFGVILVAIAYGLYSLESGNAKVHYIIGSIAVSLFACNYVIGVVLTLTDANARLRKVVMPFFHWLLGVLAYSLGMVQLFLVPELMRLQTGHHCTAPSVVVLLWVIFHVIVYLILSMLLYFREKSVLEDELESETASEAMTEAEPPKDPKKTSSKPPSKAKLYDDPFDDSENNKRLGKKFQKPKVEKPKDMKTIESGASVKSKATHATFYDDFIDPPDNIVRQKGPHKNSKIQPDVHTDKDLDGIDHFTDDKSRNMRPTSTYYLGKIKPYRVFVQFPLKTRLGWPNPNSLENEVIIAIFFILSLIVSLELCYLLWPVPLRGACDIERAQKSLWFTDAW